MVESHPQGAVLAVKAQPGARRNGIVGLRNGALRVAVTQAPERGKANRAIIEVLADELELRRGQIELLSGDTSAEKRFLIAGVTAEELSRRVEAALA
ncbi:MAG: DUF167 domain-containing protein [Planctomycetes bacterium]|nr:DUF167 domain-containing protein [Planctomycetota bacterium]